MPTRIIQIESLQSDRTILRIEGSCWETVGGKLVALDDDTWELYDTSTDWTQAHDVKGKFPEKLAELQRLWMIEATKYDVLPLDNRGVECGNPDIAGRPQLVRGNRQLFYAGMGRLTENSVLNLKNKSFSLTAEVDTPKSGAEGPIVAHGRLVGGWSLYAKGGKLKYCFNFYGLERYYVESTEKIPSGTHQVRLEFAYDGGGLAKGGTATLYLDGKPIGSGLIDKTEPIAYSADERWISVANSARR